MYLYKYIFQSYNGDTERSSSHKTHKMAVTSLIVRNYVSNVNELSKFINNNYIVLTLISFFFKSTPLHTRFNI